MDKRRQSQVETAQRSPYLSYLSSVVVHDVNGDVVYCASHTDPGAVSAGLADFLGSSPEYSIELIANSVEDSGLRWFGYDIRNVLRIMAADVMRYNSTVGAPLRAPLPVGWWYHRTFSPAPMHDPFDMLVSSGLQKDVTLPHLVAFFGLSWPDDFYTNAAVQSLLVRQLCLRAQLFPVPSEMR